MPLFRCTHTYSSYSYDSQRINVAQPHSTNSFTG
jgi:hypothetical protein